MVDIERQIEAALVKGRVARESEPRAVKAWFDEKEHRITVELANGVIFSFPPELAEGLQDASSKDLQCVEVLGNGHALHWEALDADFSVPNLVSGIFGTSRWMAARAGSSRSSRKAAAARQNGTKGGRPRKSNGFVKIGELDTIVGSVPLRRSEVISKVWDHIRKNNLQNPQNKREILADDKLRKIFGKDRVSMSEINKRLSTNLVEGPGQARADIGPGQRRGNKGGRKRA